MNIHVRAPATSANIGPGFDVAGVALDLWNELEVDDGDEPADEEIAVAWRLIGHEEGIFCERASAAGIAGLGQFARAGERVVCILTGHGLKDPEAVT